MTNGEKNEKRFDELGIGDLPAFEIAHNIAVRKNGDVDLCDRISCYECIFKCGNCIKEAEKWLADEAEPDEPTPEKKDEKMEKDEIKVGDTVKVTIKDHIREGEKFNVRKIRCTRTGEKFYGVIDFDGDGWVFTDREIEKVKVKKTPPRIVIYQSGDTVTARDLKTGETASAVCSKKDTFDIHTGAFIAMSRLTGFDADIMLMRLEMERLERYISDIKMKFGTLMGDKYPDFDEEEKAK